MIQIFSFLVVAKGIQGMEVIVQATAAYLGAVGLGHHRPSFENGASVPQLPACVSEM